MVLLVSLFMALPAVLTVPVADHPPLALSEIDDSARYLFDCARDSKWPQADAQLTTLQQALDDLPDDLRPADVLELLHARVRELADSIPLRERIRTMDGANAVTQLAAGLGGSFERVPAQIPLLGYLGRQIELGVAEGRKPIVTRAIADIRQAWSEVRPGLERRGHLADVRRMTDIVVSLEGAGDLAQAEPLARDELEMVAHLEAELS